LRDEWSVGTETPVSEARNIFMEDLLKTARQTDSTRLVSAALEVHYNSGDNTINDALGIILISFP